MFKPVTKIVDGVKIVPQIGEYIKIDGRRIGAILHPGDDYVDEKYPGSQFRIDSIQGSAGVPINIEITGRTIQYNDGGQWVRIKIEWVRDGEPSDFSGGYYNIK